MVADALQIKTDVRAPAGTILRYNVRDLWANGANSGMIQLMDQALGTFMGPAHAVQNPNNPNQRIWIGPDGVIQVEFTGGDGPAPGGFTMGGPVPAPGARDPRDIPAAPNFEPTAREVNSHVEVNNPAPRPVVSAPSAPEYVPPKVTRTERVIEMTNGTKKDGTPRKTVVRGSVSIKVEPGTRAGRK